jgi:predicted DNA-binding protein (MmcQ/YjbR family)
MIDWPSLRSYAIGKAGSTVETPFGPETAVFKVGGKMFAFVTWTQSPLEVTLKCDPDEARGLRSTYSSIRPGYHMNKRHWITVTLDGAVPDDLVFELVDEAHELVLSRIPAKLDKVA